jgi:hypothetical protein
MIRHLLFIVFCALPFVFVNGQGIEKKKDKKGLLYFALGSNRIWYSRSNIHVMRQPGTSFDFILSKVKAKDEGGLIFDTSPQFTYTVGYYSKKWKFGLEYQLDHGKYFVTQNQRVHIKGAIDGVNYDKDTTLGANFFQMEHSDGANHGMINFVKLIPLSKKQNLIYPEWLIKGGIGLVNPKTNTTINGVHRDDRYHISGYVIGVETGIRLHIGKYFFANASFKSSFANYTHFLIAAGYGKQKWISGQFDYMLGGQVPL